MATLSERLLAKLAEQNQINGEDANIENSDQIEQSEARMGVKFRWIPGFRKNSAIVWAYE